jgi:hypothetical protein
MGTDELRFQLTDGRSIQLLVIRRHQTWSALEAPFQSWLADTDNSDGVDAP